MRTTARARCAVRRRLLVDRDARARSTASASPRTSRAGWTPAQCGVYERAEHVRRGDPLRAPRPAEQPADVVRAEAPARVVGDLGAGPRAAARAVRRERERAALARSAQSMPSAAATRPTSSTVATSRLQAARPRASAPAPAAGRRLQDAGEQRRAPAAVAPGGAEPGDLPLDHHDPQRRVGQREVVRRPEPGVAGTDDRHVGVDVPVQRRPRPQVPDLVQPQADSRVRRHRATVRCRHAALRPHVRAGRHLPRRAAVRPGRPGVVRRRRRRDRRRAVRRRHLAPARRPVRPAGDPRAPTTAARRLPAAPGAARGPAAGPGRRSTPATSRCRRARSSGRWTRCERGGLHGRRGRRDPGRPRRRPHRSRCPTSTGRGPSTSAAAGSR